MTSVQRTSLNSQHDNARNGGEDGLCDMSTACRLVQDVESNKIAPRTSEVPLATVDGLNGMEAPAVNGAAAAENRASVAATSNPSPGDLEAGGVERASFKPGRSSSFHWKQRLPPSGPASGRTFKQAPAHDAHQEVAAAIILSPKETYDHIVAAGVAKTRLTLAKQVTQGVMAGFYISFSFMLCMTVGGQISTIQHEHPGLYNFILGSVGFPLGLTVIMVAGADLFTSSCMYMITAWIEGRVATYYVIKNWFLSWWANLCGCLIMAQLVVWAGLFAGPKSAFPIYLAHKKTSATFGATVVKGILCNWLVNLAVWMANSARDVTGKAVAVYLPVSAFVTLGTEHVVANMFELSLAKMLGSGIPLRTMIGSNFVPATIGNIIGGAFFVGTLYAGTYGTLYERIWLRFTQMYIFLVPRRVRASISRAYDTVRDKLHGMVDWEALTEPPGPLPAVNDVAAAAAGRTATYPTAGTAGAGGAGANGGGLAGFSRAVSTALNDVPNKLATALVAATRNPPMTPFEHKRTSHGLGSDV